MIWLPVLANAQKPLFMKEFSAVNSWFFARPQAVLVQKYVYYKDSAMVSPSDSAVCTIAKNGTAIHYKITGLESFSDKGYMVKISHADKYLYVSKTAQVDTATLNAIFNEGFSSFTTFSRSAGAKGLVKWELKGGVAGVNSAILLIDLPGHQIKSLQINMSADNALISPYQKKGQPVVVKVLYQYYNAIPKGETENLSDYISISGSNITPAAKYKGYTIKLFADTK